VALRSRLLLAAAIALSRAQSAWCSGGASNAAVPLTAARLKLDAIRLQYLTAEVLRAALACAEAGGSIPGGSLPGGRLLGCEFTERSLRFGLERSYRAQARLAPNRRGRIELVNAANAVRPRTWA